MMSFLHQTGHTVLDKSLSLTGDGWERLIFCQLQRFGAKTHIRMTLREY